jgi:hypothetical protein
MYYGGSPSLKEKVSICYEGSQSLKDILESDVFTGIFLKTNLY